ncbi:MAG: hypothetical protein LBU08_04015 [Tannerellaceae bacterium]|jgi:hypothetical protein|nr:hypothetical protein [Tannerellaceae bacterium]
MVHKRLFFFAFLVALAACQSDEEPRKTLDLALGQEAEGGIVFYISPNKDTALVASPEDLGPVAWSTKRVVLPTGLTFGSGATNTAIIVEAKKDDPDNFAARLADNLVLDGYDDWYLPDIEQLELLYERRELIGNLTETVYWSSSAIDGGYIGGGYSINYNFRPSVYTRRQTDLNQHAEYLIRPIRTVLPQ